MMPPMRISIYDKTLTRIGIIFEFISLTWEETYNDLGTLQIVVNKDRTMTSFFKLGYYVGIPDSDTLMVITGLDDKRTPKGAELWVHGFEAKYILDNRVFVNSKVVGGNVESRLKYLLADKLDLVTIAPSHGLTEEIDSEHEYPTLLELCEDFCQPVDYGFKLIFDKANKKLKFDVYEGQTINSVKYSTRFGNLYNLERHKMINGAKNAAYVIGEEVDGEREVVLVTLDGTPPQGDTGRWEVVIDASDIKHEATRQAQNQVRGGSFIIVTDEEDAGTAPTPSYTQALYSRGLEELEQYKVVDEVVFDIDAEDYRQVFDVGDKITCIIPEYNETITVRVTAARVVYEDNKRTVSLTMGDPIIRKKRRKK